MTESLQSKIRCFSTASAEWGRDLTGNFQKRIYVCRRILKQLKNQTDSGSVDRYKVVQAELFEVLA